MNGYSRVAVLNALVDLAYTGVMLGIVGYAFRSELRNAFRKARADMEARQREIDERTSQLQARHGYIAFLRERGIEPRGDELGMEP